MSGRDCYRRYLLLSSVVICGIALMLTSGGALPAQETKSEEKPAECTGPVDRYGDALPAGALQRLGTVRFRDDAASIAYSPDGTILASGGRDNVVRLFDAANGRELRRLERRVDLKTGELTGHHSTEYSSKIIGADGVPTLAFSPDGKVLASGGWDNTIRLWDVVSGKELRRIDAHRHMVGRVVYSPDGRFLASRGALDGIVKVWDPTSGKLLHELPGMSKINGWRLIFDTALAISPDSKTLAATARSDAGSGVIIFYDLKSGKERKRVPAHAYGVSLAYSPDGKLLASGGVDAHDVYSLRIWDAVKAKELRKCELKKGSDEPFFLAWDPTNNGRLAATVFEDIVRIYDAQAGKPVVPLQVSGARRVIYAPDGKTLATAGGPTIRRWDAATGKELSLEFEGHQAAVGAVAVSDDGRFVASGGGNQIRVWDPQTGKTIRVLAGRGVKCLAFAPDNKTLAGGNGAVAQLWDVETGKTTAQFKPHAGSVMALAFSSDGKQLVTGDTQSTIRVWDVGGAADAKPVRTIDNRSLTESLSLAFASDGKTVLCAGAWNDSGFPPIPPGTPIRINGKEIGKVPADGNLVLNIQGINTVMKQGTYLMQWDVAAGKEVRKFAGLKAKLRSLAESSDGKLVAASSADGRICIWDAESGAERLHIVAHPDQPKRIFVSSPSLAFSPDGKTLASASTDRTIRLWDAATGKETGRFTTPDGAFSAIAFAKDGKTLITGNTDGTAMVWDVSAAPAPPTFRDGSTAIGLP